MSCSTIKKAFEDSLNKSTINNSDEFLLYDNGTIFNTTFGDMATQLGTTGSLTGENGLSAVPVLTGAAPNYSIRGIVGGNGISAQQNIAGSITINTNLQNSGNGTDGEGLIPNTATDPIRFKRIKAGAGISLQSAANSITIINSLAAEGSATKQVLVASIEDFPTAAAGIITLADDTKYTLLNDISTSNRFATGSNTVVSGVDPFVTQLTYTGTGDMFTYSNGTSSIVDIAINCPNGTLLNTDAVTAGNLVIRFVRFNEIKNLGSLNHPSVGISNVFMVLHTGQGFTYGAVSNRRLSIQTFTVASTVDATSTFMNLNSATFTAFNLNNIAFLNSVSGQTFLSGSASGANLVGDIIGFVSKISINGDMAGLGVITNSDAGWDFTDNNKIGDTRPIALMSLDAPTNTVITTQSVPVKVTGAFTDRESSLFAVAADGRVTYTGNRPFSTDLTASITFQSASGTNTFAFYVAINGVAILESAVSREVTATTTANVSLIWDLPVVENDYLEIFVANTTGTNNVAALNLIARIK